MSETQRMSGSTCVQLPMDDLRNKQEKTELGSPREALTQLWKGGGRHPGKQLQVKKTWSTHESFGSSSGTVKHRMSSPTTSDEGGGGEQPPGDAFHSPKGGKSVNLKLGPRAEHISLRACCTRYSERQAVES